MNKEGEQKYGSPLRLVRGDAPRGRGPTVRTADDLWLDREMRRAWVRLVRPDGQVPETRGLRAVRDGEQHPWRVIGRRLREARAEDVGRERVKEVLAVLDEFVDRLYDQRTPPPGAPGMRLKKAA